MCPAEHYGASMLNARWSVVCEHTAPTRQRGAQQYESTALQHCSDAGRHDELLRSDTVAQSRERFTGSPRRWAEPFKMPVHAMARTTDAQEQAQTVRFSV